MINIGEENTENKEGNGLIEFEELSKSKPLEDEVNELIDLMTLTEATSLNEQMKELEQLELEKRQRVNNNQQDKSPSSSLFSFVNMSNKKSDDTSSLLGALGSTSDDLISLGQMQSSGMLSFSDLLNNTSDEFEREWQSAFASSASVNLENESRALSPSQTDQTEFGLFTSAGPELSSQDLNSLLPSKLMNMGNEQNNKQSKSNSSKTNWYDLFAELDPLKNPDAIGKNDGLDEERNC